MEEAYAAFVCFWVTTLRTTQPWNWRTTVHFCWNICILSEFWQWIKILKEQEACCPHNGQNINKCSLKCQWSHDDYFCSERVLKMYNMTFWQNQYKYPHLKLSKDVGIIQFHKSFNGGKVHSYSSALLLCQLWNTHPLHVFFGWPYFLNHSVFPDPSGWWSKNTDSHQTSRPSVDTNVHFSFFLS